MDWKVLDAAVYGDEWWQLQAAGRNVCTCLQIYRIIMSFVLLNTKLCYTTEKDARLVLD